MGKGDDALIGRTIAGKFAVLSPIGGGAMGQVYKARQIALEKTVALKVMHADLATDETFASRFHREAKAASRLNHPNSMRVIDFGEEPDGLLYIAMEFLDGRDLLKVSIDDWPLHPERIASILMQALAALAIAHDMGVVHRDLKPENIMILPGTNDEGMATDVVKVCDFGIAKIMAHAAKKTGSGPSGPDTRQGLFIGTPEYVSPEQGKGEPIDGRSDLYSMGVILFQLLTGRVPFEAESPVGIVLKHVMEEPRRPSSINSTIDLRLEAICLKAMQKRREDRYQSAREMRGELRAVLDGSFQSHAMLPTGSSPMAVHAATVRAGEIALDSTKTPDESARPTRTAGTGTMALPELPVERPKWVALVGIVAMAIGGIAAAVLYLPRGSPPAEAASSEAPSDTPAPSMSNATARTAPDPVAIVPAIPKVAGSASAAVSAPTAPAAAKHAVGVPANPLALVNPASVPVQAQGQAAATAPPQPATFNVATASTSPRVISATGASAADVRRALPLFDYAECYRAGLRKANKRLEGKIKVHLTIDATGFFTQFSAVGAESLLSNVGTCMQTATGANASPVKNVAPAGGQADIEVDFVPE